MPSFSSLEPAIDPNNKITFLLDWELTMKCNLDCSYCDTDINEGGHNNTTKHPPLEDCLKTLDFLFKYADLYMRHKPKGLRTAILNIYGGESLHHPHIVEILSQIQDRYAPYKERWNLTVTTTTNAIVPKKKLQQIIPYIDEFTTSYHSEATEKQHKQFKENLLTIRDSNKRLRCIVLMNNNSECFNEGKLMIEWLNENNIRLLPRQLDDNITDRKYDVQQIKWFNKLYKDKTYGTTTEIEAQANSIDLSETGRACCAGRQTCEDQNYKERKFYVLDNKFTDWYCSVNRFFVYVKQVTGEIFVNKDCRMRFDGTIGPIGYLKDTDTIINTLAKQLDTNTLPVIQCKKYVCFCGLCAPKAKNLETYKDIIKKYEIPVPNLL